MSLKDVVDWDDEEQILALALVGEIGEVVGENENGTITVSWPRGVSDADLCDVAPYSMAWGAESERSTN